MVARAGVELGGLRQIRDRTANLRPLLAFAGITIQSSQQAAFKAQKRGAIGWPDRINPNVPAIVSRLNRGLQPRPRHLTAGPGGIDTGTLRRSITWRITGPTRVEVGSSLPYAGRIHRGGVSTQVVTRAIIQPLTRFLRTQRKRAKRAKKRGRAPSPQTAAALQLGFLFHYAKTGQPLVTKVQARPYATVEAKDIQMVSLGWSRLIRGRPPGA